MLRGSAADPPDDAYGRRHVPRARTRFAVERGPVRRVDGKIAGQASASAVGVVDVVRPHPARRRAKTRRQHLHFKPIYAALGPTPRWRATTQNGRRSPAPNPSPRMQEGARVGAVTGDSRAPSAGLARSGRHGRRPPSRARGGTGRHGGGRLTRPRKRAVWLAVASRPPTAVDPEALYRTREHLLNGGSCGCVAIRARPGLHVTYGTGRRRDRHPDAISTSGDRG
jgi:hypothetical protein